MGTKICRSGKKLAQAIKKGETKIILGADIGRSVMRIKFLRNAAWTDCVKAVTVISKRRDFTKIRVYLAVTKIKNILDSAAQDFICIGVNGGTDVLTEIRNKYEIAENDGEYIVLIKKPTNSGDERR